MKKGDILLGMLIAFSYIVSNATGIKYCVATVKSADASTHDVLLGTQEEYTFATMMSIKGKKTKISAVCSEPATKDKSARFTNVKVVLEED